MRRRLRVRPLAPLECGAPLTSLARRPVPGELHGLVTAPGSSPPSQQHPAATTTRAFYMRRIGGPAIPVFPNASDSNFGLLV